MNHSKIYEQIINHRLTNKLTKGDDYTETHHIKPKSLFRLNTPTNIIDDPNNLVILTSREHFICHCLLAKMFPYRTTPWWRMNKAINAMKMNNEHHERYVNSRLYESLKEGYWNAVREKYKAVGLIRVEQICTFIDENEKFPTIRSNYKYEKMLANKLNDMRKAFKYYVNGTVKPKQHLFYPVYKDKAEELGYPDLFLTKDYEKEGLEVLKEICDFVDVNGVYPKCNATNPIEISLANKLFEKRKANKNSDYKSAFFESYQKYVDKRGYNNLFNTREDDLHINSLEVIDWLKENNKRPSRDSDNGYEKSLGIKLMNYKQRYKMEMLNDQVVKNFEENEVDIYLKENIVLYNVKIKNLCEWIKENDKYPNKNVNETVEREFGQFLSGVRKKKKRDTLEDSTLDVIKEYSLEDMLITKTDKTLSRFEELCNWLSDNKRNPDHKTDGEYEKSLYYFHCDMKVKYLDGKCTDSEKELVTEDLKEYFKPQTAKYNDKISKLCDYLNEHGKPSRSSGDKEIVALGKLLSRLRSKYKNDKIKDDELQTMKDCGCFEYLV